MWDSAVGFACVNTVYAWLRRFHTLRKAYQRNHGRRSGLANLAKFLSTSHRTIHVSRCLIETKQEHTLHAALIKLEGEVHSLRESGGSHAAELKQKQKLVDDIQQRLGVRDDQLQMLKDQLVGAKPLEGGKAPVGTPAVNFVCLPVNPVPATSSHIRARPPASPFPNTCNVVSSPGHVCFFPFASGLTLSGKRL